jgi:hypothetical protein
MTTWNFDISAAPRDQSIILETKCGKVIKTNYLPKEDRWAGLAKGEQPVAWQEWPKASGGAA